MIAQPTLRLAGITLNSPDPPALARFYAALLGWRITVESQEWVQLANPDGGIGLNVALEEIHVPPVWPAEEGAQQMQLHLEILVEDLASASAHAQACGATLAGFQPQEDVRVHIDPDGHPFCLYIREET